MKSNLITDIMPSTLIRTHSIANGRSSSAWTSQFSSSIVASDSMNMVTDDQGLMTLSQRLRRDSSSFRNRTIDVDTFRKYIAYARKYVHPILSPAAAKVLQKLYLSMRSQSSLGNSIPVTTRHLESLIRLSQARARLELRDEVTEADANDVVLLLQESLLDAFTDESGAIDIGRRGGISLAKQVKALVKYLSQEAKVRGNDVFSKKDIEEAVTRLRFEKAHDVNALIDIMRTECYLLLKGPKLYQIIET
jgi:DNA helicase MCM8